MAEKDSTAKPDASKREPGKDTGKPTDRTILVYKPDGSLQCGMGKSITAEDMEKELSGIAVSFREKRSDGLMHIQACGQPTGMVNVYEIPERSLSAAEKRGFKRLRPS